MTANGYGVFFGGDANGLELIMVMVAHMCDGLKIIQLYYFKWANCMVCALYLDKALKLFSPSLQSKPLVSRGSNKVIDFWSWQERQESYAYKSTFAH